MLSTNGKRATRMALGLLALGAAACVLTPDPLGISGRLGIRGWFRIDAQRGGEGVPYGERFEAVALGLNTPPCADLVVAQHAAGGTVYVLVHGIRGDGGEWLPVLPVLARDGPAAMFMARWVPYDERDPLAEQLATGVTRLLQCLRPRRLVVLAHSAGGVIAAFAASRISIPQSAPHAEVIVLTVAAPLAGTGDRRFKPDGAAEAKFILDLGTTLNGYPPAAVGVTTVHLHTTYPADPVMQPTESGHRPNDPAVGVPGAVHRALPPHLGHGAALLYVAERISSGALNAWLDTKAHATPEQPAPTME